MTDAIALLVVAIALIWAVAVAAANEKPRCDHRLEPDMDEETGIVFRSCRCESRVEL